MLENIGNGSYTANLDLTTLVNPDGRAFLKMKAGPAGTQLADEYAAARGREVLRGSCTTCHTVDQSKAVPAMLVELKTLWPGYVPLPAGVRGDGKLSTILNASGTFDDKMIVVDASDRGEKRGNAMPLLVDLARTTLIPARRVGAQPRRACWIPSPAFTRRTPSMLTALTIERR